MNDSLHDIIHTVAEYIDKERELHMYEQQQLDEYIAHVEAALYRQIRVPALEEYQSAMNEFMDGGISKEEAARFMERAQDISDGRYLGEWKYFCGCCRIAMAQNTKSVRLIGPRKEDQ